MKVLIEYERLTEALVERGELSALRDALGLCRGLEREGAVTVLTGGKSELVHDPRNFDLAHSLGRKVRTAANRLVRNGKGQGALDLYYECHLFDAPYVFDSFCIYIEKDRDPRKQFYMPRRKQLLPVANALQDLEEGKLTLLGISEPPGIGKTTLAEFFLAWTSGKHPDLANLIGSHSNTFLDGMYGEMLRIFDTKGEYRWGDVFPGLHVITTRARERMIDIGGSKKQAKRFATVEFGSIGSQLAGRVRAQNLLYCDDLVDGIETAMSIDRLDKLWQSYYTDLRQRKIGAATKDLSGHLVGGCKELHIATRWSVHDILGRLEREYENDPTARFISFPALNENDESNFDYPFGLGYSTADLLKQREIMDDVSWKALFMNQPIEREGILYEASELRYYFALPDVEPDNIFAVCDSKEQGSDYCAMPIIYQYGKDYYVADFICDDSKVEVLEERVAQKLIEHKVRSCRIESNRGGTIFAQNVQAKLKEYGGVTSITTRWTQTNKETRIQSSSGIVKSRFLFLDESEYIKHREYRNAMNQLCTYSMRGKNKHDDIADSLSMCVDYIMNGISNKVTIMKRPF